MNTKLATLILISLASLTALTARAQKGAAGGGGGGGSRGAVSGATAPVPSSPAGVQRPIQPGQAPATGAGGEVDANGQAATPAPNTPSGGTVAQPGGIIPQPGSTVARPGVTPVAPAPTPGTPLAPAQPPIATPASSLQRDQAITPADQNMLGQIRQTVFPPGQPALPGMSSVNFILKDGAVRLVGTVPTEADRQRIEAIVQRTPGVARVYNVLTVDQSVGTATATPVINGNSTVNVNPAGNGTAGNNIAPVPQPKQTPAPIQPPRNSFAPTNIGGPVPPSDRFTNVIYETAPASQPK